MTRNEFLYEFNLGYNNVNNNRLAPGLNEYEISVFLTMAQEQIVKNYFNPKGNKYGEGAGDSIKRDHDFSSLIEITSLTPTHSLVGLDPRGMVFVLPDNTLFILNEHIQYSHSDSTLHNVKPLSHEEYSRLISKPYKKPKKNQAWRLYSGKNKVEIITDNSNTNLHSYTVRYVRKPYPIILEDLSNFSNELLIDGQYLPYDFSHQHNSELDESLHREIVRRAVEIAKADYRNPDLQSTLMINQKTE